VKERDHWEDLGLDGKLILKWLFKKWNGWTWTGLIWLRIEAGGGLCTCDDEPSGSIKYGGFLD
jgi:hypothetical protein